MIEMPFLPEGATGTLARLADAHAGSTLLHTLSATSIEAKSGPQEYDWLEQFAAVTGAVFSAVAFLEGALNEMHGDLVEGWSGPLAALPRRGQRPVADGAPPQQGKGWQEPSPLAGYQWVLKTGGLSPFPSDDPTFDSVRALVHLRNSLVHYHPEWIVRQRGDAPGPRTTN